MASVFRFMFLSSVLFSFCIFYVRTAVQRNENITFTEVVNTTYGPLRGKIVQLPNNSSVHQFLGIPFAKANRFEAPTAPTVWNSTLDTISSSKLCPQRVRPGHLDQDGMSEDCLYLNVYVPQQGPAVGALLPVMLWIHGGAFVMGTGVTPGSDVLATEGEVIVVTINYRLGAFGFLANGQSDLQGNYGLLDQIEAMRWVQQNIMSFKGDPRNVTLFGESAGGALVALLMLSPLTSGMYRNLIIQSGSAAALWSAVEFDRARKSAEEFGKLLNCSQFADLRSCLNKKDFYELIEAQQKMKPTTLYVSWCPVVDGNVLPDSPAKLLIERKFNKTSVMIGVTKHEGGLFMIQTIPGVVDSIPGILNGLSRETFIERVRNTWWTRNQNNRTVDAIIYEYTDWSNPNDVNTTRLSFQEVYSDAYFKSTAILSAQMFSVGNITTYFYQFEHAPKVVYNRHVPAWMAVYHGADLYYVFGSPMLTGASADNDSEVQFSKDIITMWTNFAKTGNPTPDNSSIEWPPYDLEAQQYAILKPEFQVKSKLLANRMVFWNEFLPKLEQQGPAPQPTGRPTAPTHPDTVVLALSVTLAVVGSVLLVLLAVIICLAVRRRGRDGENSLEYRGVKRFELEPL